MLHCFPLDLALPLKLWFVMFYYWIWISDWPCFINKVIIILMCLHLTDFISTYKQPWCKLIMALNYSHFWLCLQCTLNLVSHLKLGKIVLPQDLVIYVSAAKMATLRSGIGMNYITFIKCREISISYLEIIKGIVNRLNEIFIWFEIQDKFEINVMLCFLLLTLSLLKECYWVGSSNKMIYVVSGQ